MDQIHVYQQSCKIMFCKASEQWWWQQMKGMIFQLYDQFHTCQTVAATQIEQWPIAQANMEEWNQIGYISLDFGSFQGCNILVAAYDLWLHNQRLDHGVFTQPQMLL